MKKAILIIVIFKSIFLFGQTPANDPHWQLQWEDEFNFFDSNKWIKANYCDHDGETQLYMDGNVTTSNGYLVITLKKENIYCPSNPTVTSWVCGSCNNGYHRYTSGWVETKGAYKVKYGYIEAQIELPFGYGFWPAFWTWTGTPSNQEIDIFEMLPGRNEDCVYSTATNFFHSQYQLTSNLHYSAPSGDDICTSYFRVLSINDYTQTHVYGLEWSPSKITWYIDGVPCRTEINNGITAVTPIILNFALNNNKEFFDPATYPFGYPGNGVPAEMRVNYVKYYKLKNECYNTVNVCNYDFSNHTNTVKKSITIGGTNCYNKLQNNQNIFMRSSEGILINGDFEVPVGNQIYLDVNTCY